MEDAYYLELGSNSDEGVTDKKDKTKKIIDLKGTLPYELLFICIVNIIGSCKSSFRQVFPIFYLLLCYTKMYRVLISQTCTAQSFQDRGLVTTSCQLI